MGSLLFWPSNICCLGPKEQERFLKNASILLKFNPKYKRGYQDKVYANCSGSLFEIGFDSGFPVLRSTSFRMSLGADGWKSRYASTYNVVPGDLLFWTFTDPNGHTGLQYTKETIAHASSTNGFIEVDFDGWSIDRLTSRRRLIFGD